MTVQPRPTPLHPAIESFTDLSEYITKRIAHWRVDFEDDEEAQHIGPNKVWMSRGRVAALEDVQYLIADAVEAERREAAEDRADEAYKDLDPVDDALEIRRLAGDR